MAALEQDYTNHDEAVKLTIPRAVLGLIERFDRNCDEYRSGHYNETQLRREFVDPLFTELGWDVENRQGYAEAYKDDIHEDAIKVGGELRASIALALATAERDPAGMTDEQLVDAAGEYELRGEPGKAAPFTAEYFRRHGGA